MLRSHVFEKRFQKAFGQHLLMCFSHFETHFGAILTLEGPLECPWDHPGTPLDPDLEKTPNIDKKIIFLDLILETIFHRIFLIFLACFICIFGNPPNQLLSTFGAILRQFLE